MSYNAASEMIRREEKINRLEENENDTEERVEEEDRDRDFPRLKNKNKIEYWEQLTAPIEREIGKLKKVWERNKETRGYRGEERDKRGDGNITTDNRRTEQ